MNSNTSVYHTIGITGKNIPHVVLPFVLVRDLLIEKDESRIKRRETSMMRGKKLE